METYTTTVREDGTIVIPTEVARPGEDVVLQRRGQSDVPRRRDDADATTETTDPVIEKWRAIGRANRAQLTSEQLEALNGDWLYDENGLPK